MQRSHSRKGKRATTPLVRDLNRFSVQWQPVASQPERPLSQFIFNPGPVDWPEGKSLLLGEINGVKLRVTRYLAHARPSEEWMTDPDGNGIGAMKFSLIGPDNADNAEQWLTASPFGGSTAVGSARVEFRQAEADTMVNDFLNPPAKDEIDPQGLLTVHYEGRVTRVPVGKNVGKKLPLDHGDVAVEIAQYLPDARLQADGHFVKTGDKPRNPVLELRVYLPGAKEPVRQVARPSFAHPGGMRVEKCAVKFWYHHPAVAAEPAVEFLAASDNRLYCRVGNGRYESRGEVHAGDALDAWGGTSVSIVGFLPHARRELVFSPVKVARGGAPAGGSETFEAAAEVELTAADACRRVWLQRGDGGGMPIPIKTSDGTLAISYGYESLPLGFSLQLKKFVRGMNPGGMGDARFASTVHLRDEAQHVDEDREISMNEPLVHGKFAFYQSGILPSGTGTLLTAASDPGLWLKYLGSIMTCAGTLVMFVLRSNRAKAVPSLPSQTNHTKEQFMRRAGHPVRRVAASMAWVCLAGSTFAASSPGQQFDWNAWRSLPVQDGGRQKPLDSLAWETWRLLGNRVSFTDPETHRPLDATAFYLATMLDSPAWDKTFVVPPSGGPQAGVPPSGGAHAGVPPSGGSHAGNATAAAPPAHAPSMMDGHHGHLPARAGTPADKWDAMPLLIVNSPPLRKVLGMAGDQRYIAPRDLEQAKIDSPQTRKATSFMFWRNNSSSSRKANSRPWKRTAWSC